MKHIAEPVSPRQGPSRVTRLLGVAKMRLKSRPLLRFGVRRFASLIVVLLGITVISFALIGVVARIGCQVLTQAFATTTDMLNAA